MTEIYFIMLKENEVPARYQPYGWCNGIYIIM